MSLSCAHVAISVADSLVRVDIVLPIPVSEYFLTLRESSGLWRSMGIHVKCSISDLFLSPPGSYYQYVLVRPRLVLERLKIGGSEV